VSLPASRAGRDATASLVRELRATAVALPAEQLQRAP